MISRIFGPGTHLDLKFFENPEELWLLYITSSWAPVSIRQLSFHLLKKARFVVSAHFHSVNTPNRASLKLAM